MVVWELIMKIQENFLEDKEQKQILEYFGGLKPKVPEIENEHIKKINDSINGFSLTADLVKSPEVEKVSSFQGDITKIEGNVPIIFHNIKDRMAEFCKIPKNHVFLQFISMNDGGKVLPHYDAAIDGFITYKCNIAIISSGDMVYVGKESKYIKENSLYCFEASLLKHWVDACKGQRLLLSYGFLVPYEELGWSEKSPRVRMSKRITRFFQK